MADERIERAPDAEYQSRVLGWAREAVEEGEAFLKTQEGYSEIDTTIDMIMGASRERIPSAFSTVTDNRIGKAALDLAAGLTDVKPFWDYRTSNKRFEQQAEMLDKLSLSWWLNRFIDLKFMSTIQYALAGGSSYAHQVWSPTLGDIDMYAEDPRDVLPIRPSSLFSVQDAFGVDIRRERTVNYVRSLYPSKAGLVRPDRDASTATLQAETRAARLMDSVGLGGIYSAFYERLWGTRAHTRLRVPTLDLHTLYVRDNRRNTRDDLGSNFRNASVWMGLNEKGEKTNWSYEVPVGQPLYPRKRCIVFSQSTVFHDGPSMYWHGLFPVSKLTLDPWPWTWLGKSPLKDVLPLQRELDRLQRVVADHNQKVARPDIVGDKNAIGRAAMDKLDTRRAGLKLRTNPVAGKSVEIVYAQPLDASIGLTIKDLRDEIDYLSGVRDVTQLMRLGQIPSAETVEKILEAMSPAIRLRSRVMEAFLREFAMMLASNFFQFYTLPMRMAVLGTSGMALEDFDFDPATLIPEFVTDKDREEGIRRTRDERAAMFLRNFSYHVAPGSLLEASQVTRKLLFIQLARQGWCDIWTLGEVLGISQMGAPPEGANTIPERLAAMQQMGLGQVASPTGGRKATAQQMPHMTPTGIRETAGGG